MADDRTVLVTGGAGYIGSHTCKALARQGYLPVAFDSLVNGHAETLRWGPLELGDITNRSRLDEVIASHRPSAIIHFAAFAYVGESVREPGKYYRNNVVGTLTLLEAMRDGGVRDLVFSSSCATYGVPDEVPIPESAPQRPINPYGASKLMAERLIADFAPVHAIRSVSLRYFNAAGADPDGELGEVDDPETHLLPLALEAAAGRGERLVVFGGAFPTADGTCVRDYVHVSDLAAAHIAALEALSGRSLSLALNLGTGHGYSVRDVLETVSQVTGRPVPHVTGSPRPGDPPVLVADPTRAREELGWNPQRSDLESIIGTAWAWHNRHG